MDGDPICSRCSKLIYRGTGTRVGGELVHVRCRARDQLLRALREQERARLAQARAQELVERTGRALDRARTARWICAVCGKPLRSGGKLEILGDQLQHARCRAAEPEPPNARKLPSCAACRRPIRRGMGRVRNARRQIVHQACVEAL